MKESTSAKTCLLWLLLVCSGVTSTAKPEVTILDESHYSHVFAETRHYRIFLPPGYSSGNTKKYPVIYFLHGWSQRYFGSGEDRYAEFDKGNDNGGENFENYVASHDVIIVKSDGYNRASGEDYYLRPYNIGPVENHRQFPVYFPELIGHIDATYRTLANRENRGITGLSMGGFMAFVIGGKYPHLFSGVGNFCGSPEFFIGPKDMPVEYRHIEMYKNYGSSKVRLHYGDKDFIRAYHEDLNRTWPAVQGNYSFRVYPGEHSTTGMNDMLDFLMSAMKNPLSKPEGWDHIDLYPSFDVWNYQVISDRKSSGYTIMEKVSRMGFRIGVKSWLPDGEWQPWVKVSVLTDAIYEKNKPYVIHDYSVRENRFHIKTLNSDQEGRLKIDTDGSQHVISVMEKKDEPRISVVAMEVKDQPWIIPGENQSLKIKLINNGTKEAKNIRIKVSATGEVNFKNDKIVLPSIPAKSALNADQHFELAAGNITHDIIRFVFLFSDGKSEWKEHMDLPVRKKVALFSEGVAIGDGKVFTVYKGGTDMETVKIGEGNGDGIADAGETIEVLVKDKDFYRRTQLFPTGGRSDENICVRRGSDYWGNYDNVGGSAKYTAVLIPASSAGKRISLFAEYWLPEKPMHRIMQGMVEVNVVKNDQTGPVISWVNVPGNNTIQAKVQDGSAIKRIRVRGYLGRNEKFIMDLSDDGKSGDVMAGDQVFSGKINVEEFGFYRMLIEAEDVNGNISLNEIPEKSLLYK